MLHGRPSAQYGVQGQSQSEVRLTEVGPPPSEPPAVSVDGKVLPLLSKAWVTAGRVQQTEPSHGNAFALEKVSRPPTGSLTFVWVQPRYRSRSKRTSSTRLARKERLSENLGSLTALAAQPTAVYIRPPPRYN
jgi:hypothetical protein